MPSYPDWLAEVRSNPYAEQLVRGVRRLRFAPALEGEYRTHLPQENFELRRVAVIFALCAWLSFIGVDVWMIDGPLLLVLLAVRLGVALLLVGCARYIFQHVRLSTPLCMLCIGAMGLGTSVIIALGRQQTDFFPYEGLLLVCIAGYFLVGLRLVEAAGVSLLVLICYALIEWLGGLAPERLFNNLLFLISGNLIGAVGCYLLERKSREQFLIARLMGLLAHQDSLTGLHNRRSFDRELPRLWRQAQREGLGLALLLCDVDHFKAYNDRYGHQAGDRALQRVGEVLRQGARRPLDMAVRLGGEEFAVLLYDIGAAEARERGEALCRALQAAAIEHAGSTTAAVLTMSIGIACQQPQADQDPLAMCAHADRALYEAKAFGRNQVVT